MFPSFGRNKVCEVCLQADIFVNNLDFVGFLGEARIHLFLFSSSTEKPKTFVQVVE